MNRNLIVVSGILMITGGFLMFCVSLRTFAESGPRPSPTPVNFNKAARSNSNAPFSNRASNEFVGNSSISNTGEFIPDPVATGETTVLEEAGVTLVYPEGYSMADVKTLYYAEEENPARFFTTRAELNSPDYGLQILVLTSHEATFEECMRQRMQVFKNDRSVRTLKKDETVLVNGMEVTTSSGTGRGFSWRMDAIRIPDGALLIVSTGTAKDLKSNMPAVEELIQSVKLK